MRRRPTIAQRGGVGFCGLPAPTGQSMRKVHSPCHVRGDDGTRTRDILIGSQTLSQPSSIPAHTPDCRPAARAGRVAGAAVLLGLHPADCCCEPLSRDVAVALPTYLHPAQYRQMGWGSRCPRPSLPRCVEVCAGEVLEPHHHSGRLTTSGHAQGATLNRLAHVLVRASGSGRCLVFPLCASPRGVRHRRSTGRARGGEGGSRTRTGFRPFPFREGCR